MNNPETRTFKNISNDVFVDGQLVVKPGESFSTDNPGRITQMTDMYDWQFKEVKGDAPSEDEVKARPNDVREIRASNHVQLDEEGKQAEKIDQKH